MAGFNCKVGKIYSMNYPIYCKDLDNEGITWTYRIILSERSGIQYSYQMRIQNTASRELFTHDVEDSATISLWLFELETGSFTKCSSEEALQQLVLAQKDVDALIKKAVVSPMQINTKEG